MSSQSSLPNAPQNRHWVHALTGVTEISLLIGLSLFAAIVVQQTVSPGMMEALGIGQDTGPNFLAAARAMGLQIAGQYGVLVAGVALVGWPRGRRKLRDYAIAAPTNHPRPLAYGVFLGLIASIPFSIIFILQDVAPIGADTPFWAVQREAEWDWTFWLFMGVGSYAAIPLVEEFAWRGYVQGRLMEGFAPGAAILLSTLIFALLHVQYLQADMALQLTFAGLIVTSLCFGVSTWRTGSLVPAIIAHAIVNTPSSTPFLFAKVAIAVALIVIFRKAVWRELTVWAGLFLRWSTLAALPALAVIAGVAVLAVTRMDLAPWIGAGLALLVLAFGFLKRSGYAKSSQ